MLLDEIMPSLSIVQGVGGGDMVGDEDLRGGESRRARVIYPHPELFPRLRQTYVKIDAAYYLCVCVPKDVGEDKRSRYSTVCHAKARGCRLG